MFPAGDSFGTRRPVYGDRYDSLDDEDDLRFGTLAPAVPAPSTTITIYGQHVTAISLLMGYKAIIDDRFAANGRPARARRIGARCRDR